MADYFFIQNGKVANIIVCDSKEVAEMVTGGLCIERTDSNKDTGMGYLYDADTNNFIKPEEPRE